MTERISRIFPFLLIAPAVLPLVYVGGVLYPYIAPKTLLLITFGILSMAAFAYLALLGRPFFYERLRSRITWIPAALLAVAYATAIPGVDFYRSFWGLFDRGDGLLMLTIITGFFYLILISADRHLLERLVKTVAIVAGIVALIAVLQWFTAAFGGKPWFLPPVTGRIGSTFGNAAFLAGYLGMAFFIILIALRDASGLSRRLYQAAAALSLLAILLAATRGTILAILAAGGFALLFSAWKGEERTKRAARYGLVALVVFAGLFFIFRAELAQSSFEPVRRIASISLTDDTVASRLFVWQNIGAEALRHPIAGYGAEHIDNVFDKIYDPSKIIEQWFDRSHNAFLDYLVQYGVFGLALYLALIGAFAVSALRLYRREESGLMNYGFLFLLLILTYTLQNFFVFDTPSSFWLLYAVLAALIVLQSDVPAASILGRQLPFAIPAVVSVLVALLIVPTVVMPLFANVYLTRGYMYHLTDVEKANAYFKRGLVLGTYADLEYGYQAYDMYTERQAVQLSGEKRVSAYKYALSILTDNFNKYPYDARTATYLGHVLDTAPPGVSFDDTFDEIVLSRAIELSPLRAQAWYMTVNISLRKANAYPVGSRERESYYREAVKILETYSEKEPALPVPKYILATLYYALGDAATAKKLADEALPLYKDADLAAARPAVKYYIATGDWRNAARFLADMVESNPSDHEVLYDLAKVTYLAGDPAVSLRIFEKLRAENPAIVETDQNFLHAITAYEQTQK